jgi:type II secretory pathway pseudopilin PulG
MATPGQNGSPFDIVSLGADGTPGGEGENADIRGSEQS